MLRCVYDLMTRVAWHYLQRAAPLRPGEGATLFRFWMARDRPAPAPKQRAIIESSQHGRE
jgi:hypothetical protein